MNQIKIGTYSFGWENVDLYAITDDSGGEFYFCPDATSLGRIKVGLNYKGWNEVVSVLVHEAFEYAITRNGGRYNDSMKFNGDHANYLFVFNHCQFGMACSAVGEFISNALPDLSDAYRKNRKKKRL